MYNECVFYFIIKIWIQEKHNGLNNVKIIVILQQAYIYLKHFSVTTISFDV